MFFEILAYDVPKFLNGETVSLMEKERPYPVIKLETEPENVEFNTDDIRKVLVSRVPEKHGKIFIHFFVYSFDVNKFISGSKIKMEQSLNGPKVWFRLDIDDLSFENSYLRRNIPTGNRQKKKISLDDE